MSVLLMNIKFLFPILFFNSSLPIPLLSKDVHRDALTKKIFMDSILIILISIEFIGPSAHPRCFRVCEDLEFRIRSWLI